MPNGDPASILVPEISVAEIFLFWASEFIAEFRSSLLGTVQDRSPSWSIIKELNKYRPITARLDGASFVTGFSTKYSIPNDW